MPCRNVFFVFSYSTKVSFLCLTFCLSKVSNSINNKPSQLFSDLRIRISQPISGKNMLLPFLLHHCYHFCCISNFLLQWVHMLRNRMYFSTTLQCWVHMLRNRWLGAFYSLFLLSFFYNM